MKNRLTYFGAAMLVFATSIWAAGQSMPAAQTQAEPQAVSEEPAPASGTGTAALPSPVRPLLDFKDTDVKFDMQDFMGLLRDRRHEGWVLSAYPDPKTGLPLIGAGFSLDLPEREHPQTDPLNPHPFLEPSSAQLWQAAGLDPARLQTILQQYNDRMSAWGKRRYRRKIKSLMPQITDEEAMRLLRISAIQSIENARAYCRNFDQLTGPQQMALSQLVYQMGVNLEEFEQFLSLLNGGSGSDAAAQNIPGTGTAHWRDVQQSLIQSQWARHYRVRAISVIAMLDPQYLNDPDAAESRISATLRPRHVAHHRRRRHRGATLRAVSYRRRHGQRRAQRELQ